MQNKNSNDRSKSSLNDDSYPNFTNESSDHMYYEHPGYPYMGPAMMQGAHMLPPFSSMLRAEQEESLVKAREAEERRRVLASRLKMPKYFKNYTVRKNFNMFFCAPGVFQHGMNTELMERIIFKEWGLLNINDKLKWVNYNFSRQLKKKKQEEDNLAKGRMRMQSHIQPHQQLQHKNIIREQSVAREILPQQSLVYNDRQHLYGDRIHESPKKQQIVSPKPVEIGQGIKPKEFKPQIQLVGKISSGLVKEKVEETKIQSPVNIVSKPQVDSTSLPIIQSNPKLEIGGTNTPTKDVKQKIKFDIPKASKNESLAEIMKKVTHDPYRLPNEKEYLSFESRFKGRVAKLEGKHIDDNEPIPSARERYESCKAWLDEIEMSLKFENIDIPETIGEISDESDPDDSPLDEISKRVKRRDFKSVFKTEILDADDNLEQRTIIKQKIIEI